MVPSCDSSQIIDSFLSSLSRRCLHRVASGGTAPPPKGKGHFLGLPKRHQVRVGTKKLLKKEVTRKMQESGQGSSLSPNTWSPDLRHHLEACRVSGPQPDLWNQNQHFNKLPR